MRYAAVSDVWNELNEKKGPKELYLENITFENVSNIKNGTLDFSYGLTAICGANGVGKSTILEAISSILITDRFINKHNIFLNSNINLKVYYRGSDKTLSNQIPEPIEFCDKVKYIQTGSSVNCITRFKKENNLNEYLESLEEEVFSNKDLENISQIIGKEYKQCKAYLLEEDSINEEMPFFIVSVNEEEYDSRNMGIGEHSVIYIYYYLRSMRNSIILLEEPENFLPPYSQVNFIHLIGRMAVDNKLNIILTTHSDHILNEIPKDKIIILRKNVINKGIIINKAENNDYLKPLGLQYKIEGYFLVEDYVAGLLCKSIIKKVMPNILNKYEVIEVEGGCSEIDRTLQCYKSDRYNFNIIGVFDGDMNNDEQRKKFHIDKYKWNYTYLPYDKAIEDIIREKVNSQEGLQICDMLRVNQDMFIEALSDTTMYEKHDWIHEFCRQIRVDINVFIDTMVEYLMKNEGHNFNEFITFISSI